ncbi:MAG: membrane dipeptidase [bacterium]|nr:membrane dipeptidase [bacterium]
MIEAGFGEAIDASAWARRLGVSREAVELVRAGDTIDLHLDTMIPPRLWGYDPLVRHTGGPFGRHFFGHADLPRLRDGGVAGALWSLTTNPFRSAGARLRAYRTNRARLRALAARSGGALVEADTLAGYRAARARGAHVCLPSIQGANAVEAAPDGVAELAHDGIVRVTLVHLTNAVYGATSSPLGAARRDKGLTAAGRRLVEELDAHRIFVDLAHIHERAFFDAVSVHDRSRPLLVTHTGVTGVRPHWRNLTDAQLRAIADSGGTIGIIFQAGFLARPGGPRDAGMIAEHVLHVMRVVGDDFVSLGSDYDGAITPPPDLPGVDHYPRVVQQLLDRGVGTEPLRKLLGGNFLRVLGALRPG